MKATDWRSGMNAEQWRTHVVNRLRQAGAVIEQAPSGAARISTPHGAFMMVSDIKHVTANELRRLGA